MIGVVCCSRYALHGRKKMEQNVKLTNLNLILSLPQEERSVKFFWFCEWFDIALRMLIIIIIVYTVQSI